MLRFSGKLIQANENNNFRMTCYLVIIIISYVSKQTEDVFGKEQDNYPVDRR